MKTQNTLENKAKLFAQYWGQNVQYYTTNGIDYPFQVNENFTEALNITYLLLTSLKNITDEDAIEVGYILLKRKRDYEQDIFCKQDAKSWIRGGMQPTLNPGQCSLVIDYLRSKGYLVPYMDLSVEDLIDYGWVIKREEI